MNILCPDKKLLNKVNHYKQDEIELADYFFVLSDFAKKSLTDNGINEDKIFKINLGFDKNVFTKKMHYRNVERFKVLFVGSITRRKGIQTLLDAISGINERDIELTMVGNIGDASDLLRRYKGSYRHVGFQDHQSLAQYYKEADILVFPSILDSWAMVVVEAMACGTPVIISDNTGSKELVSNGKNGFVINTGNTAELQEKIMYFYNNRDLLPIFGKHAVESVKNYSWENYSKNLINTIDHISSKHSIN